MSLLIELCKQAHKRTHWQQKVAIPVAMIAAIVFVIALLLEANK